MDTSGPCISAFSLAVLLGAHVSAQVTQRVSVATGGAQGNGASAFPSLSADGRYVAFESLAANLVIADTNGGYDVFVRDRQVGSTERASLDWGGAQVNGYSGEASISADGRYVAFASTAPNVVLGDTNARTDIFVHDRQLGTTERVSVDSSGAQSNDHSLFPSISADGRFVAFASDATNLVGADTNGSTDVFVRDRLFGTTERVSVASGGAQGNTASQSPSISADGRYVAFDSFAGNLVSGDTNGLWDVFVHDRQTGMTERVSVDSSGAQGSLSALRCSISADGLYVAFDSSSTNLVGGDTNGFSDVFVHDRQAGTTERVSVVSGGAQGNGNSYNPAISADGRYIAFESLTTNLVPGDTNGLSDVFVHDRQSGTTQRVNVDSGGAQANDASYNPSLSADGRYVAYESLATNLVSGDTNGVRDVFVHDRTATGFTSLCDTGFDGVRPCPCSNSPSGLGRGCDNSAATGGAILSASGIAYLSMDSLVFTTSGEKPTATSIVLQGNALAGNGVAYGQGVRCVGGTLRRLYTKAASGGSISAPNFGAGDPTVSARSAAKGDPIQAGQSRWYLVYYRDPIVLGGCPASSTFNATQTGEVAWSP